MKVEIDTNILADIISKMSDNQIRGLFWYIFGYYQGGNDPKFFEVIIKRLSEKDETKL